MKSIAHFPDEKVKQSFLNLQKGKEEHKLIHKWILKAVECLEENAFSGIQIPKRLIPKDFVKKYDVRNLWKYNLPEGWRLIYSIKTEETGTASLIICWLNHKEYEKRLNY